MKIENNHDNVEYKLKHLVKIVDEVCENYGHVDESEHASMLLALDRDMIQVAHNIQNMQKNVYKSLYDPYKIDYEHWSTVIDDKRNRLENLLKKTGLEDEDAILRKPKDIVEKENNQYKDVNYLRIYDTNLSSEVRISLMHSRLNIYWDIINGLRAIIESLNGIDKDKEDLLKDDDSRDNLFKELLDNYSKNDEWKREKETFKRKVKHYVAAHIDKEEGYKLMLEEHEDLRGDDVCTNLKKTYLDKYDLSIFIVKCRNEIEEKDMNSLFAFMLSHKMLQIKAQSFEVLKAPDNNHNKLFINQGAQELIETMIPLFNKYVYFNKAYKFAALYYAIQDMGLMPVSRSNAPQFVNFVGKHFKEKMTNDTITKKTKLLSGKNYGKVVRENYKGTTLNDEEFDALRNEYHLCLSIINVIMKRNLREEGFAEDVWKEHRDAPSFIEYEKAERLILLRDILQGKHTEI